METLTIASFYGLPTSSRDPRKLNDYLLQAGTSCLQHYMVYIYLSALNPL